MADFVRGILYETDEGTVLLYPRCPQCYRFIKHGNLFINGLGDVLLKEWFCRKHGEVKPHYEFVDPQDLVKA